MGSEPLPSGDTVPINCGSCPYSCKTDAGLECRARAPMIDFTHTDQRAAWPRTDEEKFCGDHPSLRAMENRATNAPLAAMFQDMINDMMLRQGK